MGIPANVQRALNALLSQPGVCEPSLRRATVAHVAWLSGGNDEAARPVPDEWAAYVDKVARHAYQVTDEDVQALKDAGYSEDAIFEVTLSAAMGAGLARLERGLQALKG